MAASFHLLKRQVALNDFEDRVTNYQSIVGAEAGQLRFSTDRSPMNQVVGTSYEGFAEDLTILAIYNLNSIHNAQCWKLDVEGHELAVLAGVARILSEAPPAATLCEDWTIAVQYTLAIAGPQSCAYNFHLGT